MPSHLERPEICPEESETTPSANSDVEKGPPCLKPQPVLADGDGDVIFLEGGREAWITMAGA